VPVGSTFQLTPVAFAPVGRFALTTTASAGFTANGHIAATSSADLMPVSQRGHYIVSFYGRQDGPRAVLARVRTYNEAGGLITTINIQNGPLASVWSNYLIALGSGTGNPLGAGAKWAQLELVCVRSWGTNTGDTTQYFQEVMLQPGTTIRRHVEAWEQVYWPSVSSSAAYTDAPVVTPSGTQVRFACNGFGHTGQSHRTNLRDLLSCFNGHMTWVQTAFWITAGWEEPARTLTRHDLNGDIKIRAASERRDRYNHVRGLFTDPLQDWQMAPMATISASEFVARDGGRRTYEDIRLPFTNDWFMAQRVAFGVLDQGDNQHLAEFSLKHSALDLVPGRTVAFNLDVLSWAGKAFRMTRMSTDLRRGVVLNAREDFAGSYVDPTTHDYMPRDRTEITSRAPFVPQISSVTIIPRDGGIQLKWVNPSNRSFE
jgi:hypothetical protein